MPGGGPHPLGQGIGREGAGWLCSCLSLGGAHGPNCFISRCRHILLLLLQEMLTWPWGSQAGRGRQGRKQTDLQLVLIFPQPFQSYHEPHPWGW